MSKFYHQYCHLFDDGNDVLYAPQQKKQSYQSSASKSKLNLEKFANLLTNKQQLNQQSPNNFHYQNSNDKNQQFSSRPKTLGDMNKNSNPFYYKEPFSQFSNLQSWSNNQPQQQSQQDSLMKLMNDNIFNQKNQYENQQSPFQQQQQQNKNIMPNSFQQQRSAEPSNKNNYQILQQPQQQQQKPPQPPKQNIGNSGGSGSLVKDLLYYQNPQNVQQNTDPQKTNLSRQNKLLQFAGNNILKQDDSSFSQKQPIQYEQQSDEFNINKMSNQNENYGYKQKPIIQEQENFSKSDQKNQQSAKLKNNSASATPLKQSNQYENNAMRMQHLDYYKKYNNIYARDSHNKQYSNEDFLTPMSILINDEFKHYKVALERRSIAQNDPNRKEQLKQIVNKGARR